MPRMRCEAQAGNSFWREPSSNAAYPGNIESLEHIGRGDVLNASNSELSNEYCVIKEISKEVEMTKTKTSKFINTSIKKGSREVYISNQNTAGLFLSRLYVNKGQTATLTNATHKTLAGATRWANKILAR